VAERAGRRFELTEQTDWRVNLEWSELTGRLEHAIDAEATSVRPRAHAFYRIAVPKH
jgi:hypothetical protein